MLEAEPEPEQHAEETEPEAPAESSSLNHWLVSRRDALYFAGFPVVLPFVLFVVLRPDWYTLQNGLDPYFYTGWAQNLSNGLAVAGTGHYSVSRWSIYLPARLFYQLFGAQYGFVFQRWVLTAVIVAMVLAFGHRRWGRVPAALAATCVILNPMFIRAIFSDYADVVVLPFGIAMILLLIGAQRWRWAMVLAGMAAGLCVVANIFATTMVLLAFAVCVVAMRTWRRRGELAVLAGAGGAAVVFGGLLLFRWRYGIADVYKPSIDFVRNFNDGRDPLKKLRSNWVGFYLWIYAPPLVLAVLVLLARLRRVTLTRAEKTIVVITGVQYVFQMWWQLAHNGTTLEISYYWMYILPSFALATAILVGRAARLVRPATAAAVGVVLVALLVIVRRGPELLPNWVVGVLAVGAFFAAAVLLVERLPVVLVAFAVLVPIGLAFVYPRPLPLKTGDFGLDAGYATVFHSTNSPGQRKFLAGSWLVRQIRVLPQDVQNNLYYWSANWDAFTMAAMELATIDGRLLNDWTSAAPFNTLAGTFEAMSAGRIKFVALLGTKEEVDAMESRLAGQGLVLHALDVTTDESMGQRVAVVRLGD
ncbi:MAG: hypothetical protein ABIQ39_15985 [Ilumatobacteraceae bacterium]